MAPTLSERIERDGITVSCKEIGVSDDGRRRQWQVTLRRGDFTMNLPDPYEDNEEPTALAVLGLLTSHCNVVDQASSRTEWAGEYTFDPEEQERYFPEEKYQAWKAINLVLQNFLGDELHEEYLYETESDD